MFDPSKADHVFIAIGYTNLRSGIDGLVNLVANTFYQDPQTNSLFLFCGRKKDRIKGLYWDGDGYLLLYKRLEEGRFKWPRNESGLKELTQQYLNMEDSRQLDSLFPANAPDFCRSGEIK